MNKTVEIYFDDLVVEAQEYLLEEFDTTKKKENWDVFPITVIDRDVSRSESTGPKAGRILGSGEFRCCAVTITDHAYARRPFG
jgi:hypothetical protein